MRARFLYFLAVLLLTPGLPARPAAPPRGLPPLPYADAGLSEREAAAHLLGRFTFGPRPGDVDSVVAMGLERWLELQLRAGLPEGALERRLEGFEALNLPATEIPRRYPNFGQVRTLAVRDSVLTPEEQRTLGPSALRTRLQPYMEEKGYRSQRELIATLFSQKLLRAVYSRNQLSEVLVDFWFNHFNVSLQDAVARPYVLSYERDALRPHVLGSFRTLLGATARHPAMLHYLDNVQSVAPDSVLTAQHYRMAERAPEGRRRARLERRARFLRENTRRQAMSREDTTARARRPSGINENYARELMELHTLGVDGGYTQADVTAVARAFTGWQVTPPGPPGDLVRQRVADDRWPGSVIEGDFLFRSNAHDASAKQILGTDFPAGGGLDEGERVLDLLAAHPSTARHLARKLAVRFVSDDPPETLVTALADVFTATGGDLRAVVQALAYTPEFWQPEAVGAKIKSPFELSVSVLRALDADVRQPQPTLRWVERMGQPLYRYLAPTGYPDRAEAWINAGTLVNRMNFAMQAATGRVQGLRFDLLALNGGREPASVEEALTVYTALLLPGHDPAPTVQRLLPLAGDPAVAEKLAAADTTRAPTVPDNSPEPMDNREALARTVGVILGSPAFQRR